jgi:chromate transporter
MLYLKLFWAFLQIGLFSIGGGYAAMPLIEHHAVDVNGWLTLSEFTDLITIAEMTPGPIAVNSATFVGVRIAGIPGAIIATFGCILPGIVIGSILSYIYFRYKDISVLQSVLKSLRPAVVALIAAAGLSILKMVAFGDTVSLSSINYIGIIIFIAAFFVLRKFKASPILVMVLCGVAGLSANLIMEAIQ